MRLSFAVVRLGHSLRWSRFLFNANSPHVPQSYKITIRCISKNSGIAHGLRSEGREPRRSTSRPAPGRPSPDTVRQSPRSERFSRPERDAFRSTPRDNRNQQEGSRGSHRAFDGAIPLRRLDKRSNEFDEASSRQKRFDVPNGRPDQTAKRAYESSLSSRGALTHRFNNGRATRCKHFHYPYLAYPAKLMPRQLRQINP